MGNHPEVFFIPPIAFTLGIFAWNVRTLYLKDRFVERIFTDHRELWVELGQPQGWHWSSDDSSLGGFTIPYGGIRWWEINRPDPGWLSKVPEMRATYVEIRKRVKRWNLVVIPLFVLMWVAFMIPFALFAR